MERTRRQPPMYVELKGLGIELTENLSRFCNRQIVEPLLRIYDRQGPRLEIELSDDNGPKGGLDKRCRISFEMPHSRTINIIQMSDDIYRSIDLAARRFLRLVNRRKTQTLRRPRYPTKYFAAKMEHLNQPGEVSSPEDITQEDDSLAAAEERERLERNPPPMYAGEPATETP